MDPQRPDDAGPREHRSSLEDVPGALDPGYAARYTELYLKHWWWRAREEVVVPEVMRLLAGHRGEGKPRILDVGCGDGLIFPRLEKVADIEGIEPDAALVSGTPGRTIHTVPFEDFAPAQRYSLILLLDVLEHLADPVGALSRCRRLLQPGGRVLLTVPAFNLLWTDHDRLNHHFTRYRRKTLGSVVAEAGLRVDHSRYLFHWLFPAKLVTRAAESLRAGTPSAPVLPPAPVNRGLFQLCRFEERTLGRLRLPFGSSLLMACEAAPR